LHDGRADTLKECADGATVKAFIRWYKKWIIVLALCIVRFSLVTFITSAISDAIRKDIQISNALAAKLGDEVRSDGAHTNGKEQGSTQILGVTFSDDGENEKKWKSPIMMKWNSIKRPHL
jgi:hypothetical protein